MSLIVAITLICGAIPLDSYPAMDGDVDITSAFVDPNFLAEVRYEIGKPTGAIYKSDVDKITNLAVYSSNISDLSGIEHFTALAWLYCYENKLTVLDVSKNTALASVFCNYNQLTTLDVSGCTALETLECYDNRLTTLDVRGCPALSALGCHGNYFRSEADIIGLNKSQTTNFAFDPQHVPGDFSGNGEPSQADVDLLAKYVSGDTSVAIDPALADVTHDGVVDMRDATYLARAIAGCDGYPLG